MKQAGSRAPTKFLQAFSRRAFNFGVVILGIEGVSGCRIVMVVEPCIIYRVGHEVVLRWRLWIKPRGEHL